MRSQRTPASSGVAVVRGYGIKLRVADGHLSIEDGVGSDRRTRRFNRAAARLRRLIVIGHDGYITLSVARWCRETGCELVHLDSDGTLLSTSAISGREIPALRRAQALAPGSEAGAGIARAILREKITGEAALLGLLPGGSAVASEMELVLARIGEAEGLPEILECEAIAAQLYWSAWEGLPVRIAPRRHSRRVWRVPEHWRSFAGRRSLISGRNRQATDPANAILNFSYALLYAEARIACRACGLDPGLGLWHADSEHRPDRASAALDVMEASRPRVDAWVLKLLRERALPADELGESAQGVCRLSTELAAELAEGTVSHWREALAPWAERATHELASVAHIKQRTPLSRRAHSEAMDAAWLPGRRKRRRRESPQLPVRCADCGVRLSSRRYRYCGECRAQRAAHTVADARARSIALLAGLREEGRDPTHGGAAAKRRSASQRERARSRRGWSPAELPAGAGPVTMGPNGQAQGPGVQWFERVVAPGLRLASPRAVREATGLSKGYVSQIRSGRVPHPCYWPALLEQVRGAGGE